MTEPIEAFPSDGQYLELSKKHFLDIKDEFIEKYKLSKDVSFTFTIIPEKNHIVHKVLNVAMTDFKEALSEDISKEELRFLTAERTGVDGCGVLIRLKTNL